MRKLIWSGVLALGLTVGVSAQADSGWGFYGSYWEPADVSGAFGVGGGISMEMIPNLRLDIRATSFSNLEKENAAGTSSLDVVPLEAIFLVVAPLAGRWGVYGGGGIGYYFISGDFSPNEGEGNVAVEPDNEIGGIILAGTEFNVVDNQRLRGSSRTTLFAEVTGRFVEANHAMVKSGSTDNADLSGVGANVGLMVRW